jgi:hypothetical protein
MAQATHTPSISLSVSEAAAEIGRLINSRGSSPRQDELEAIVCRVVAPAGIAGSSEIVVTQTRETVSHLRAATVAVLYADEKCMIDGRPMGECPVYLAASAREEALHEQLNADAPWYLATCDCLPRC